MGPTGTKSVLSSHLALPCALSHHSSPLSCLARLPDPRTSLDQASLRLSVSELGRLGVPSLVERPGRDVTRRRRATVAMGQPIGRDTSRLVLLDGPELPIKGRGFHAYPHSERLVAVTER